PLQLASYYSVARLYKVFFDSQGENVETKTMIKVALELNFVNHVFPSGGVSGFSYLSLRLKRLGISTAKSTLAQLLRFALTFISFLALLVVGVFVLSFNQSTSAFIVLICSVIIFGTIFGSGVGIFIISNSSRIKAFVSWLPRALNYTFKLLRISKRSIIDIEKVENTLEDLHQNYVVLRQNTSLIKRLLLWALLINIFEVATIYMVYIAFGTLINPGALIIAYAAANFAGLIAVLPGGVGVYEGLMTATLASAGVPQALALSATVIYRVLSMVVFLPIGYYFYHVALGSGGEQFKEELKQLGDDTNLHS
ncbi:MAG: flippase-like domain-containing protein, partial [bacterium]|nr:flippase-like domain-containing protein [bacterium]